MVDVHSHDIEGRKQRWRGFLSSDSGTRHILQINYQPDNLPRPLPWRERKAERIEWAWESYQRHFERTVWLHDDSIPCLNPFTGTEIFAEAFGCPVHCPEDNMPFALPLIRSASEVAQLRVPSLDVPALATLFEIADELQRRAGPKATMKLVDIQSPMDIVALIWDKNDLYTALIEAPEAVKELAAKVRELLITFLDEWFARYGREFIAHYPAYYMPCGITLSEDEVGAVSEEMFIEFYLPELVELSEQYGGIGMHCCADATHQWKSFKKIPNLRMLNLVQPVEELRKAYQSFATDVPQMHSWCGRGPAWTWPQQYPEAARVVMSINASTREEALELVEKVRTASSTPTSAFAGTVEGKVKERTDDID
ncbi:MAG: uroporphyrinogen decarboxylase family protein [Dehalococcoidia bacterium]|jgi:hypothetical protein|nr:uroporphyrinogen decarboxylase family protein [Dehalococcoidia bacterium]|tara:strand:+ start:77 stop:1180 length:1104 start_codon:yes stop_codon:yes gene_type:complete